MEKRTGFLDWMFRSRQTARITLAQLPNWPLVVWLSASAVMWLGHPQGWVRAVLAVLASAAPALWAGALCPGDGPQRRHPEPGERSVRHDLDDIACVARSPVDRCVLLPE